MNASELIDFAAQAGGVKVHLPRRGERMNDEILGVATDSTARRGHVAWISQATVDAAPERLLSFAGSLLICPSTAGGLLPDEYPALSTESPKRLFSQLLVHFFSDLVDTQWPYRGFTVSEDSKLGVNVQLSCGVVIGPRVILADGVSVGPNTCIANSRIDERVSIGANCSIGLSGFGFSKSNEGDWIRFPHLGHVRIERDVEIGSNTCIDRGAIGDTVIRRGAKIDNLVHIAHNCDIGERALIIANSMIGGSVTVGRDAWIAPSAAINNQIIIGAEAVVGTGSIVIRHVDAAGTVVGNPAKPLKSK